jgi:hypothetical protein
VLASELTKEAVLERMKLMGKGITLVSHEVRDGEGGSRESVAVFKIPDVSEFQYASPYMAIPGYQGRCVVKGAVEPRLGGDANVPAGLVCLRFDSVVINPARAKGDEKAEVKGPTPADLQILRHLQPVLRDMLAGIRLKFTVESYAPVTAFGLRNGRSGTKEFDLIDFSDSNLDAYGVNFLENEEVMLEMAQMKLNGPNIQEQLKGFYDNLTLPVFYVTSQWGGISPIWFRPSRHYFDKYFQGKTVHFGHRDSDKRPAKFEEIGWPPTAPNATP